jgi:hypothetical protein
MKKALIFVLLFGVVFFAPALIMAQDPGGGVGLDPLKVDAILLLLGGGIAALVTQLLKTWFKLTGTLAVILTGVVGIACTVVYFKFLDPMVPWNWFAFALYAVAVFGEATGFFHFYKKTISST